MKKLFVLLFLTVWCIGSLYAQFVKQSWDFESSLGGWSYGWISGQPIELSQDRAVSGIQSAKVSTKAGEQQIIFAKDGITGIQEGYIVKAKVWVDDSLVTRNGVIKFFWQSGSSWDWYDGPQKNLNQLVANEWNEIEATLTNVASFKRLGIQVWMSEASVETIYIDDIVLSTNEVMVSDWGIFRRGPAPNWKFVPSTTPGSAGLQGTTAPSGPWTALRGEFPTVSLAVGQTIVVTGAMVFDSAGIETWNALRFGLYYQTQAGTLYNSGTDSARWKYVKYPGTDSAQVVDGEEISTGYMFAPPSSTFDIPGWANGGGGTQGIVRNSSWLSTYGNNLSTGIFRQKPDRAIAQEGAYNFAISVRLLDNGTKEVKFFLVKPEGNTFSYWWAGTFIDTTIIPATFNSLCFGINGGSGAESGQLRGFYLSNIKVSFGEPIVIPEAPWVAYYIPINNWGVLRRGLSAGWSFVPGTFDGGAGLVGTAPPKLTWNVIRGAFTEPVELKPGRSLKVTGKVTFDSAGITVWNGLRFGLNNLPNAGTVYKPGTDSARWQYVKYAGTDSAQVVDGEETGTGYLFCPPVEAMDIPGWASGGGGTHGIVRNNSTWLSTYGSNLSGGIIRQKPDRAKAPEGTYEFAIQVRLLDDGTKQVKFYFVKPEGNTYSYWWAGTFIDTTIIPAVFNGVCFGIINSDTWGIRGFTVEDVQVDTGDIVIPEAPWVAYYIPINNWGVLRRGLSAGWSFVPGTFDGGAGLVGTAPPKGTWNVIRGAFTEPVELKLGRSLKVTGKVTFDSAGIAVWNGLRFGLNNLPNAGTLYKPGTDSARWQYVKYAGTDSAKVVDGEETGTGYLFCPPSGTMDIPGWSNGGGGTHGIVRNNSVWLSTYGQNLSAGIIKQAPARAIASEGSYDFGISVRLLPDGTKRVRFYLAKPEGETYSYWWGGTFIDTTIIPALFNGVCFGIINSDTWGIRGFSVEDVQVDTGEVVVPEAPWQKYYVTRWGVLGKRFGGWLFETGTFDGNAGIVGTTPNTDVAAIGGEIDFAPSAKRGLKITGQIDCGFAAPASLRLGVFNAAVPGKLVVIANGDSTQWDGRETNQTGLLIIPRSGNNPNPTWGTAGGGVGSIGTVTNATWFSPESDGALALGDFEQSPKNAVADSGVYDFALSITKGGDEYVVRFKLWKEGYTYAADVTTASPALAQFNFISFALMPGNNVTGLRVYDVLVDTTTTPIDVGPVSGVIANGTGIPREFALSQNYPNPFNPSTTINYDIPMTSNVKITIYDILGRAVATLVNEVQAARSYSVQWNASNFSSGVYFCRIEAKSVDGAKNFTAVKKLLLMK